MLKQDDDVSKYSLDNFSVVFEEHEDEGDYYVVAECLELPGCVSQGATRAEAEVNVENAMHACLSVIFEAA